jgi:DNA-binding transcriptional LysR family regulator
LHARLAPLLSDLDAALREAADLHGQPRGLLRVSARRSFGLLPAVAGFHAAFPEVELDLGSTEEPSCGRVAAPTS